MVELWYAILVLILGLYIVLDGWAIGAGVLHYAVAPSDADRRTVMRAGLSRTWNIITTILPRWPLWQRGCVNSWPKMKARPAANPPSNPNTSVLLVLGLTGACGNGECSTTLTAVIFTSFETSVCLIWRNTLS